MKLSLNWLKKYLNIAYTPEKIAEMLTIIGLEVEGIEKVESIKGGLDRCNNRRSCFLRKTS
jgi:phenylalanyl-tRNA synthetase beta chain